MADPGALIDVEVAYATPQRQRVISVKVAPQTPLREVIAASGILIECPEIDIETAKTGIFGKPASLSTPVNARDRVEIYRPLQVDPKEARRRRARRDVRS